MSGSSFWQLVMNTMSDGFFMVTSDGRICDVNQALCDLTGYSREELLGQPCSIFACDACSIFRKESSGGWCNLFIQKLVNKRRCHIRHKLGHTIPVFKNARLLAADLHDQSVDDSIEGDENGPPLKLYSVETVTDIRELVERDAYIQKVERLLYPEGACEGIVGTSPVMKRLFQIIEQAASSLAPVLIMGESGTGKELVARALHKLSSRAEQPFVELNCAALNEQILESELFGHVKGAFTGAFKDRAGRFEAANGGTLFLDEIGDIPMAMQIKLLRVLETGVIERVGDNRPQRVDVRIVSATNRNMPALIEQGVFREDLAFRINVIPITVPPLRERVDDIPLIVSHFLRTMREFSGRPFLEVHPDVLRFFRQYPWPGNVRELRNILEYAAVMTRSSCIGMEHLPDHMQGEDACFDSNNVVPQHNIVSVSHPVGQQTVAGVNRDALIPSYVHAKDMTFESRLAVKRDPVTAPLLLRPENHQRQDQRVAICHALAKTGGNVSQAARLLGIHRTTLINRMLRFGIRLNKTLAT